MHPRRIRARTTVFETVAFLLCHASIWRREGDSNSHWDTSPRLPASNRPLYHSATSPNGAPGRIRTCNLLIRSQMLYPLSYRRMWCPRPATIRHDGIKSPGCCPLTSRRHGAQGRGRTGATHFVRVVHSLYATRACFLYLTCIPNGKQGNSYGADYRTRTDCLSFTRAALFQMS